MDIKKVSSFINKFIQVLNIILITAFMSSYFLIRGSALNFVTELDKELALIQNTTFVFNIHIIDEIPIDISIPLSQIIDLNKIIPESVHIQDTFQINQTIPINQDVNTSVYIPFTGNVDVTIPIKANIPVNLSVPIDTNVKIGNLQITDQLITVNQKIPIDMELSVEKNIDELGLSEHIIQIHNTLNALRLFFLSKPTELSSYDVPANNISVVEVSK